MRKIYSLVLMAAMLLVGANAWATTREVATTPQLETQWAAVQDGDTIKLTTNVNLDKTLWLGTATMNATPISITLDLNGHKLISPNGTRDKLFFITHGELNVTSSVAGGEIIHGEISPNVYDSKYEIFRLAGSTYKNVDPKTATSGYYTHLTIDQGVTLTAKSIAICIDKLTWPISNTTAVAAGGVTIPDKDYKEGTTSTQVPQALSTKVYRKRGKGLANGVRVDVYGKIKAGKYAFKSNGNLGAPTDSTLTDDMSNYYSDPAHTQAYTVDASDVNYSPFIRLYPSADMWVQDDNNSTSAKPAKPVAVYCSGYARWMIEGTCIGSTGVYVKSGDVDIHDATIQSTYTGTYTPPTGTGSGTQGQGSAIVIESSAAYSGEIDVDISGDTKVTATNGYAIDEKVTTATSTEVNTITISGGSFEGGTVPVYDEQGQPTGETQQGTISISQTTKEATEEDQDVSIVVAGGTVNGEVTVGNQGHLSDIMTTNTYSTTVTDPETGKQTVVISAGSEPVVVANDFDIDDFTSGDVNLSDGNLANKNQIFDNTTIDKLTIGTLMMNNDDDTVKLTIAAGHTIEVGKVTMGYKAQIIVKAGAKLIVTGDQGITAPANTNIILEAQEGNQAIFLFKPSVSSNRHPKATVNLISKAYRKSDGQYVWQRFGVPAVDSLYRTQINYPNASAIKYWDNGSSSWQNVTNTMAMKPFVGYEVTTQQPTAGDVYSMACNLMGNGDASLTFLSGWNYYANSYTGEMDIEDLVSDFLTSNPTRIMGGIYVYKPENNWWDVISFVDLIENQAKQTKLDPMQAFLANLVPGSTLYSSINYENVVWNHRNEAKVLHAPARVASDMTKVVINITSLENGRVDDITLRESDRFTSDFDNGYEMEKLMHGESFNVYANTDFGSMVQVASDDILGQMITLATAEETSFKMTFSNIYGQALAIRDNLTGTVTNITADAEYYFTAGANTTEDRFQIVGRQEMPTDVETIEQAATSKAIYTVQGQYVGETADWNRLPKGIYIVDGVKMVK